MEHADRSGLVRVQAAASMPRVRGKKVLIVQGKPELRSAVAKVGLNPQALHGPF
jgi:hypothetical protein